jgi:hypothetical protein
MTAPFHSCPGGCGKDVPARLFACRACWARLPGEYKREIDGHRVGSDAHRAGMRDAMRWYADHPPRGSRPAPTRRTRRA